MKKILFCLIIFNLIAQLHAAQEPSYHDQLVAAAKTHNFLLFENLERGLSAQDKIRHEQYLCLMGAGDRYEEWCIQDVLAVKNKMSDSMVRLSATTQEKVSAYQGFINDDSIGKKVIDAVTMYDGSNKELRDVIKKYAHVTGIKNGWVHETPLDFALKAENEHSVILLLDVTQGVAMESDLQDRPIPLQYYTVKNENILKKLFEYDIIKKQSTALLKKAIIEQNVALVELTIHNGADIHAKTVSGNYPLLIWALKGKHEPDNSLFKIVQCLIHCENFLINCLDPYTGDTALHIAIKKNWNDIAKLLFDKGITLYTKNNAGDTPLSLAVELLNVEVVRLLTECCENIGIKETNKQGNTVLYVAAQKFCCLSTREKSKQILKILFNSGADVNAKNDSGNTILHYLAYNIFPEDIHCLQYFFEQCPSDINVDLLNNINQTPLDIAYQSLTSDVVDNAVTLLLKEKGCKRNRTTASDLVRKTTTPILETRIEEVPETKSSNSYLYQGIVGLGLIGIITFLIYCLNKH